MRLVLDPRSYFSVKFEICDKSVDFWAKQFVRPIMAENEDPGSHAQ